MKRFLAGITLVAIALLSAHSVAGAQRAVSLGIQGGLSLPTGDLGDVQQSGYHVGGHLGFTPGALPFEIMVDLGYHSFQGDEIGGTTAPDLSYINVNGSAVYVFPGGLTMRPYVLGGLGMYFGKVDVEGADRESDLGFNVGAGVRFMLTGLTTYVQGRAHFVDDNTFIPLSFGVIF